MQQTLPPSPRNTMSGIDSGSPDGRQARRLCEVATQWERSRDKLLAMASWPPFLELTAHTGVGLRWAREEETWHAGRAEDMKGGSWVAERKRRRRTEMEEKEELGIVGLVSFSQLRN